MPSDEGFYRSLADASPNGVLFVGLDGCVRFANPRAAALTGVQSPPDLIGRSVSAFVREPDRRRAADDIATLTADGVVHAREYRLRRPDGNTVDANVSASVIRDANGAPRGYAVIVADITLAKERERSFVLLFENNPLAMWVYDLETLRFLEVNDTAVRHYGYSRDEFLSMRITDIRPAEDLAMLAADLAQPRGPFQHSAHWRHRRKDGTIRQVEIHSHTMQFNGRNAVLVVVDDVTEHHHLEQQFQQAQRLDAVGRLAAGVAHDFNNTLTVVDGYADLLLTSGALPPQMREYVNEIKNAASSAASLTMQLLAFARKQIVKPTTVDPNIVITRLQKMLARLIGDDISIHLRLAERISPITIGSGQLEQIVLNLAVNARDAMPQGGTLTLETADVELDENYAQTRFDVRPGRYVMIAVSDTGAGMTRDVQARLFEPFFTTKAPGMGTGLGLASVFGIVKQNLGNIWVYSEPERGATFKIYLPAQTGVSADDRLAQRTVSPYGDETVLVVDDDSRLRKVAQKGLELFGYTVLVAADGAGALEVARTHPGPIDILVTDVVMPGLPVRSVAQQIMETRPQVRVLYTSGYTTNAIVHHGILDDGIHFIQKPFAPEALATKIREVLDVD